MGLRSVSVSAVVGVALLATVASLGARQRPTEGAAPAPAMCDAVTKLSLPNVSVTSAQLVAAGAANPFADLPAFCRVAATLRPSSDSDIRMELWMPMPGWNGKLRGTGNGGLGGGAGANANALAAGLRRGYATTGNNTGHEGDSRYALDHPEKIKDFGYRAAHEMTVASKAMLRAFYGRVPQLAYMAESGGGTIAALSSAQRYPGDYDALAVTGMSSHLTRHTFGQMWVWQATHKHEASFIPAEKYAPLHQAALGACDAADGLKDGIIGDVEGCRFDPAVVECKGSSSASCLTAPQVEAARKLYAGPRNARTGAQIYSPLYPGSELGWGQLAGGAEPLGIPVEFFKSYVFRDPAWDYKTKPLAFDDAELTMSDRAEIQPVNAVATDLRQYFARGGKLLLIGGWNDTAVPPKVAVDYDKAVVAAVGAKTARESLRFFMVPGMGHGVGTAGVENFNVDTLSLIEQWTEQKQAPDRLVMAHYKNGVQVGTRLVCQYPQIAFYKGTGNTEDAASFECRAR